MRSHLDYAVDIESEDIIFNGRVCRTDFSKMAFDSIDKAVLGQPIKNAADAAQNLEIIFFRMQQQLKIAEGGGQ